LSKDSCIFSACFEVIFWSKWFTALGRLLSRYSSVKDIVYSGDPLIKVSKLLYQDRDLFQNLLYIHRSSSEAEVFLLAKKERKTKKDSPTHTVFIFSHLSKTTLSTYLFSGLNTLAASEICTVEIGRKS